MSEIIRLEPPTDLGGVNMGGAVDVLNAVLADLFALYVKTKNFHWHMTGPHFRDYHLLLDDQGAQIFAIIDPVAERIRKAGYTTLRSIGDIARHQTIVDNDEREMTPRAMLLELRADNLALIETLRTAKQLVDEARDNATSGLIDSWTDEAEQRAWFLYEATRGA